MPRIWLARAVSAVVAVAVPSSSGVTIAPAAPCVSPAVLSVMLPTVVVTVPVTCSGRAVVRARPA